MTCKDKASYGSATPCTIYVYADVDVDLDTSYVYTQT